MLGRQVFLTLRWESFTPRRALCAPLLPGPAATAGRALRAAPTPSPRCGARTRHASSAARLSSRLKDRASFYKRHAIITGTLSQQPCRWALL